MKKRHCFTLVEILTAVVIVGILSAMGLGIASYARNRSKEIRTQATLKMIEQALEQHRKKFGDYPVLSNATVNANIGTPIFVLPTCANADSYKENLVGCFNGVELDSAGTTVKSISGMAELGTYSGYKVILDGWGQPIIYIYPGVFNKTKYDLGSFGPDKKMGDGSSVTFTVDSDTYAISSTPDLGSRSSGAYKTNFGFGDDIVNFKR